MTAGPRDDGIPLARPRDVSAVAAYYTQMVSTGRGHVVFVCGPPGSGRSDLLRSVERRLSKMRPAPRVIAGALVEDADGLATFHPSNQTPNEPSPHAGVTELLDAGLGLAGNVAPAMNVVAQILKLSQKAREYLRDADRNSGSSSGTDLIPRLLRLAAQEGEVVVVVDDADRGVGPFWRQLSWSLATQVAASLPLLLVLAVEADRPDGPETYAAHVRQRLTERGLAGVISLGPFARDDVADFVAPADDEVVEHLFSATGGDAALLRDVWNEWVAAGVVSRAGEGRWAFTSLPEEQLLAPVADAIGRHLDRVAPDEPTIELADAILRCGALEGREFTAQAVALALGVALDQAIDVIDDVLCRSVEGRPSLVVEVDGGRGLEVTSHGRVLTLWRYRFRSLAHWLALSRYGFGPAEVQQMALRLAESIKFLYAPNHWRVSRTLARLYREAGKPESAVFFQRLTDFGGSQEAIAQLATETLESGAWDDIDAWEAERLAETLLDAIDESHSLARRHELAMTITKLMKKVGPRALTVHALIGAAVDDIRMRNLDGAKLHLEQAMPLAWQVGDTACYWRAFFNLGLLRFEAGDREGGREQMETAIRRARSISHAISLIEFNSRFAELAFDDERYEDAVVYSDEAVKWLGRHDGALRAYLQVLMFNANAHLEVGAAEDARRAVVRLLDHYATSPEDFSAESLIATAELAETLGDLDSARRLLAAVGTAAIPEQDDVLVATAAEAYERLRENTS